MQNEIYDWYMHIMDDGRIDGITPGMLPDGEPNIHDSDFELGWAAWPFDEDPPNDFPDYRIVDGELVYEPLPKPPVPVSAEEVLGIIIEAQQEEMLPLIPDAVIERMESWFPEWDGDGHAYEVGNLVTYGYVLYRCVQAHTSQSDWTPDVSVSLWAKVLADKDEPQPWVQPESTNPYMKGDRVTHNGHIWVSDIDYNVFEPGVYGWTIDD